MAIRRSRRGNHPGQFAPPRGTRRTTLPRHRKLLMEALEQRALLDGAGVGDDPSSVVIALELQEIDVKIAVVATPSSGDVAAAPPDSIDTAPYGGTYYVEAWLRGTDPGGSGIIGGRMDLLYDTALADAVAVEHGGLYAALDSGSIDDARGRVKDFGGGTFDEGQGVDDWVRLGYVEMTATDTGYNTLSLEAGSLHFARALGDGNVHWDLVDLSDEVTVLHNAAVDLDMRVVRQATATDANGEVDQLPEGEDFVHEWEPYFVEIYLGTRNLTTNGILGGSIDLHYDTTYATPGPVEFGPAFTEDQHAQIQDNQGQIKNLRATTTLTDAGDDRPVLFARIPFTPHAIDQVPVDEAGHFIGPYDFGLSVSDTQLDIHDIGAASTLPGDPPRTGLWAMVYDIDDNDLIDYGDFSYFAGAFNLPVDQDEPPWKWWADFDKSDTDFVDFGDFAFFAQNFGKTKGDGQEIVLPGNYPDAWEPVLPLTAPLALVGGDTPIAVNDTYTTQEDIELQAGPSNGVLANDVDDDPLIALLVEGPSHGELELGDLEHGDGRFSYTPDPDFFGTDSFSYMATDGRELVDIIPGGQDRPIGVTLDLNAGHVYWSVYGQGWIQRADLDGGNVQMIVDSLEPQGAYGIAVDPHGGKLYWANYRGKKIQRANLDGTEIEDLVTGLWHPQAIALDLAAGKMYFSDSYRGSISRANLDGTGVEQIVTGLDQPHGIAINLINAHIYWVDWDAHKLQRANLDGTDIQDIVTGLGTPRGVAVDPVDGKVYWSEFDSGNPDKILRADLDGSNVETVLTRQFGLLAPRLMAIDTVSRHLYFADSEFMDGKIQRLDVTLSGRSNVATVTIDVEADDPNLIAGDDGYATEEDVVLVVSADDGLLTNDTGAESFTSELVAGPSHGNVTLNGNGSFTYTPDDDFFGTDSFAYKASETDDVPQQVVTGLHDESKGVAIDSLAGKLYVGSDDTIWVSNLDGSNGHSLITDQPDATSVAIDSINEKVYWVSGWSGASIRRANLDGTGVETLVTGLNRPRSLVLDPEAGKMYWTQEQVYYHRANLDGSERETLGSNVYARAIALDVRAGKLYAVSEFLMTRYNLDGTGRELLIDSATGLVEMGVAIAVDPDGGWVYWMNESRHPIHRAKLDGTSHQVVESLANLDSEIELDLVDRKVYVPTPGGLTRTDMDPPADSNVATVTIDVSPVNDAPVANEDDYVANQDNRLVVAADSGVLDNDTDADDDPLTARVITEPEHGTLVMEDDGAFVYTPEAGYTGPDGFSYVANDGTDDSNLAQVALTVNEITIDIALTVVATPGGSDTAAVLPASIDIVDAGEDYYVEIWAQDKGLPGVGVAAGRVDIVYTTALADATELDHSGVFTVLTSGTIDEPAGLVDNFGGGSFLANQGIEPNWVRMGYVRVAAVEPGETTFQLAAGDLQFSRFDGGGNIGWSLVDTSDLLTVYQRPGSVVDMTAVETPTATEANGEVDTLPESLATLDEWDGYWLELWLSTPDHVPQGVQAAAMDLVYDTAYYSATEIQYSDVFALNRTGTIDDTTGRVNNLGAATTELLVGDDRPALLARVHFQPTTADQVPVDEAADFTGPYNLGLSLQNVAVTRSGGVLTIDDISPAPATGVYAVPYDVNDDDVIDEADFAVFEAAFSNTVGDAEPPYAGWADFDDSGLVDFNDFGLFAARFGDGKPAASAAATGGEMAMQSVAVSRSLMLAALEPSYSYSVSALTDAVASVSSSAGVNVALVAVSDAGPSDTAAALPASLGSLSLGQTFTLEIWVQDASAAAVGVTGGSIDVGYSSDSLDPTGGLDHGDTFNLFTAGTLDDAEGLLDDFGGATMDGGIGVAPGWARLGYMAYTVTGSGPIAFDPDPGAFQFGLFNAGNVPWDEVSMQGLAYNLDQALELGPVDYVLLEDLDLSAADRWYRFQSSHDGFVSLDAAAGGVRISLYDAGGNRLAGSSTIAGRERLDWQGGAAETYYCGLTGTSSDVDLLLVNLVNRDGDTVTVTGTDGDDVLAVDVAGAGSLTINGVGYAMDAFDGTPITTLHFDGGDGSDTALFALTDADETVTVWPDRVELQGQQVSLATLANVETLAVDGGGGTDWADYYDSPGDDTLAVSPLSAAPLTNAVSLARFETVYGYADSGGNDKAVLYDTPGDDVLYGKSTWTRIIGDDFFARVISFDAVECYASQGHDKAYLIDTRGDETFSGNPTVSSFIGDTFGNTVHGFDLVNAAASGGADIARLYDSPGNDSFTCTPTKGTFSGDGFTLEAENFPAVHAYAGTGWDEARLYDSPGDDTYTGAGITSRLEGPGFFIRAKGFDKTHTYAAYGGYDVALMSGTSGDDTYLGIDEWSKYYGPGYFNRAKYFEEVIATRTSGGTDVAHLYDSPGDDVYTAAPKEAHMQMASGITLTALRFPAMHAYARGEGYDKAYLTGSALDDVYQATQGYCRLRDVDSTYILRVKYFEEVYAQAGAGGYNNIAYLLDSKWDDRLDAEDNWARVSSNNTYIDFIFEATGFDWMEARQSQGHDIKQVAADLDFELAYRGVWLDE